MGFLQLTPENIAQAKSLSYPEAFKLDRTLGYNPNFKGGVNPIKYASEGIKSIFGFGDQKIGGATPLTRKIALDAMDFGKKGINFAGKVLSKASLPFSILMPTELGSAIPTKEEREKMMGIMNSKILDDYYTKGELYEIDDSNKIPGFRDKIEGGIDTLKDKLGSVGDYIKGGGIMGQVLQGIGDMFQYKGGIGYVDENGNFISAEDIDKQNARGGYYTDAARASRRRDKSIARFRARGADETKGRFAELLKLQQAEEAARVAAERAKLDAYFRGFEASGGDSSNRYDGADSFEQYSAEPTAYSGSS
tara:strand:+ start:269 stop:1189 length:921 start_codon:yes stop_codon:yes gene_type:complete